MVGLPHLTLPELEGTRLNSDMSLVTPRSHQQGIQVHGQLEDEASSSDAFGRNPSLHSLRSLEEDSGSKAVAPSSSLWQMIRKFSSGNMSLSSCGETAEDAYDHDLDCGRYEGFDGAEEDEGLEMVCHHQHDARPSLLYKLIYQRIEKQVTQLLIRERQKEPPQAIVGLGNVLMEAIPRIVRMSELEPYGVRGAKLIVRVNRALRQSTYEDNATTPQPQPEPLAVIALSSSTVSTFEVLLTLNEEKHIGISIKNWLRRWTGKKLFYVVSQEFKLEKRQLYRSSSWSHSAD